MTLLSVMLVLSVLALMSMGAARLAIWGERLSQGELDLAVSFEAAEAALWDAEWDVMGVDNSASARHCDFVASSFLANRETTGGEARCGVGPHAGVCFDADHPGQAWRRLTDVMKSESGQGAQNQTVAYGQFTGASWASVSLGGLVAQNPLHQVHQVQPPRYLVEWAPLVTQDRDQPRAGWVVTAVGFGLNPATQTWLQVVLNKPGPAVQTPCKPPSLASPNPADVQKPWVYLPPRSASAMPHRWRCHEQATEETQGSPPSPAKSTICGRLSWRELAVGGSGFTLIELLVVVAILGVLSAVAYPQFAQHLTRVKRSSCQALVMQTLQAQERYKSENATYRLLPLAPSGSSNGGPNEESPACAVGARACAVGVGVDVGSRNSKGSSLAVCIEVFAQPLYQHSDWAEMSLDSQGRTRCVMDDSKGASNCWP
jgi:prepilin-type N-terminal cleavage/methylation domain-containing protein